MKNPQFLWFLVPAFLLVLAILPLPYGYYTFLRIAVTAAAAVAAVVSFRQQGRIQFVTVGMGLLAIAFNPLVPIFLSREIWLPVDIAAAAFFVFFAWREGKVDATSGSTNGQN